MITIRSGEQAPSVTLKLAFSLNPLVIHSADPACCCPRIYPTCDLKNDPAVNDHLTTTFVRGRESGQAKLSQKKRKNKRFK
jgi:hypothetical protein